MKYYIGCHLSGQNIFSSIDEVNKYGGNIIQIFVSNPIGRQTKNIIEKYIELGPKIKKYILEKESKIVIHSPYVLNFAKKFDKKNYIFDIIFTELKIANLIGAIGCVIHVGKYLDLKINEALQNMYLSIKYIINFIERENLNTFLILETAAGQGTELLTTENNTINDLANFYARFTNEDKKIFKICIDTCHIFSAGFDIQTNKNIKLLFRLIKNLIGIENIALIHLNNSKTEYDSHKDRHERIGLGSIKKRALKHFVKESLKYNIPLILETPEDGYIKEIPWIIKIINKLYP